MFDIVDKVTDHDNQEISQLSQRLLDEWSELKSVYRIPKRAHTVTKPILEEEDDDDEEEEDEEGDEAKQVEQQGITEKDSQQQKPSSQHKHPKYHQKPFRLKGKARKKARYYESTREFFDPDEDYFEYFTMQTTAPEMEWMIQYPPQPVIPTAPRAMLEPSQTASSTPTTTEPLPTTTSAYYYPTTAYYDMNTQYIDYQNYNSTMYYTADGTAPEDYYYAYQQLYPEQQQSQWGTAYNEEGAVYYYNIETGEAQWQVPQQATDEQQQPPPPPPPLPPPPPTATVEEERLTPTLSTSGSIDVDESGHLNDIELKRQVGKIVTKYLSAKQQTLWKGDRTLFKDLARKVK
jgi:hypothetical protein